MGIPQRIVLASTNPGKISEMRVLLGGLPVQWVSFADLGVSVDVDETGATFEENALLKARAASQLLNLPAVADDSGLEVDALGGAPGIHSARYAGPNATDAERNQKLLSALAGIAPAQRTARFRCSAAFVTSGDDLQPLLAEGTCSGTILDAPRGKGGFGYDPLFWSTELHQTFAEAPPVAKDSLSHRGLCMRNLAQKIAKQYGWNFAAEYTKESR